MLANREKMMVAVEIFMLRMTHRFLLLKNNKLRRGVCNQCNKCELPQTVNYGKIGKLHGWSLRERNRTIFSERNAEDGFREFLVAVDENSAPPAFSEYRMLRIWVPKKKGAIQHSFRPVTNSDFYVKRPSVNARLIQVSSGNGLLEQTRLHFVSSTIAFRCHACVRPSTASKHQARE